MLNIAVFASGRGSNFEALQHAIITEKFPARIVLVLSNNSQSGALALARSFNIPAFHISQRQFNSSDEFDATVLEILRIHEVNFIVLAGYMKQISEPLIKKYPGRIINIHPALLPKFGGKGMYGIHVHEAVIAAKEKVSGATVHRVDAQYDEGSIIEQEQIDVDPADTPESLAAKVLQIEHALLPKVVKKIAETTE